MGRSSILDRSEICSGYNAPFGSSHFNSSPLAGTMSSARNPRNKTYFDIAVQMSTAHCALLPEG